MLQSILTDEFKNTIIGGIISIEMYNKIKKDNLNFFYLKPFHVTFSLS